jgi:hypothetical protein
MNTIMSWVICHTTILRSHGWLGLSMGHHLLTPLLGTSVLNRMALNGFEWLLNDFKGQLRVL